MHIKPSQFLVSLAPHVKHSLNRFGTPNLGSERSLTASTARTDIFSCYNITKRFNKQVTNTIPEIYIYIYIYSKTDYQKKYILRLNLTSV